MRIRQIVFAAADLARSRALLSQVLQLSAPFRDPGVAEFGIDNAVFCFGDQFIEVISPTQPDTACGRHLARLGDGGYMLILQTDSLARERAHLDALGVRRVWQAEFDDIAAMHLHPKDIGGAIVSLDEPRPAAAWRWGGPDWRVQPGDAGRQRVQGLTLRARDPAALARRWAQVLARPAPQPHGAGWRVALDEGFADFVAAHDGMDAVSGFTLAVADVAAVCERARAAGLAVTDSGAGSGTGPDGGAPQVQLLGAACTLVALNTLAANAG
ncbi:VOC family protein [Ideonella sp. DXS22W]|uniref:VOC family protein n=1 Tax=Pseudaquabacterium inlustre TaxID=2984192 RepID=A0ABU9CLG0_9BURK